MRVYLICELSSSHDGDWRKVEAIVREAKAAGCSACKLQYWSSADRLADRRRATDYYRDIYRRYQIPQAWLPAFYALCHEQGMEAVCTVFLPEDVAFVAQHVDRIKIASFENEDASLVEAARATGKPVIVSHGMVAGILPWMLPYSRRPSGVHLLSCVSAYPAALDGALASLHASKRDEDWPGYFAGFSDHTRNVWTGAVAVGCGAQIIEVHVRAYDTEFDNPDYAFALDPDELRQYAEGVRTAERLIADVPVDESAMRKFKVVP